MKFAVIGTNAAAVDLLRELVQSPEHSAVACAVSGSLADAIAAAQLPLRLEATAEDAILAAEVDVVVVAVEDPEENLRLSRMASQADKHVVVFPPSPCSPAFTFELHLILDESRCAVIPLIGRFGLIDIALHRHELSVDASQIQQLALELVVDAPEAPTGHPQSPTVGRPAETGLRRRVESGLDVLSASGLKYSQVTALDSLAPDGSLLSRLITLNSQATTARPLPPATLLLRPVRGQFPATALLRLSLSSADPQEFAMEYSPRFLPRIAALCQSRELCSGWMESFSATLELAEAVDKSLRRRRTVDVHFDTGSERGVFKSQMTAMGCGVLMFMMFGMVAYLIIAQLADLPKWMLHVGRVLWITPLVVFLIAQALLPLTRKR